jgi:uncharacterized protein
VLDRLLAFSEALRDAGVPVSVGENLDAVRSVEHVEWLDRSAWRSALAATMIKSEAHRPAFDLLFELYFGLSRIADDSPRETAEPEQFIAELADALGGGDGGGLQDLAERAVEQFGRVEDSPSGNLFFEYPIWRAVDTVSLPRPANDGSLESTVANDAFERRLAEWRRMVQVEVRRRVVRRRGAEVVARYSVRPLPEDLIINTATADDIQRLRRSVQSLARKLATRLSLKHRRARHGRLDMRRTVRRSLSTGGAPFDLVERKRAPHRPELFVLCDISDSVARFARFSLMLVHALAWQFTKVRSFVFLETIDEVTRLFEREDFINPESRISWDTGDSLASVYASCIDDMAEVRTLRQLERFIALRL